MDETDIVNEIRNTGDAATLKKKKGGGDFLLFLDVPCIE